MNRKMADNPDQSVRPDSGESTYKHIPVGAGSHSELMTEAELIYFLRIPEVSNSKDYHNVVDNLRRTHHLPCIHICKKPLYPLEAARQWVLDKAEMEQRRL